MFVVTTISWSVFRLVLFVLSSTMLSANVYGALYFIDSGSLLRMIGLQKFLLISILFESLMGKNFP